MVDEVEAWRARQLEAIDDAVRASDQARRLLALAARMIDAAADARREAVVLRRELAARRGRPDAAAPVYEGHSWTSEHGWSGPFHLVAVERVAYPGAAEVELPAIEVPARRALCGVPFRGFAGGWPAAVDVCPVCVSRATQSHGA